MTRRVVITGMGLVSALGCSVSSAFHRLHTFQNAVVFLPELDKYQGLNTKLAAPITDFNLPESYTRKVIRTMGPVSIMSLNATEQALTEAGLVDNDELTQGRCGVAYGSSFGSVEPVLDFFSMLKTNQVSDITSSTYLKIMPQTTAVNLSVHFKTTGRLVPTGTACTSGSLAIGNAYELIKYGIQDIMIAGGAEEFSPTQVAVFDTLYATSTQNDSPQKTPAPFDSQRDGLVIGEGAATLILEEYEHAMARGAPILAEVVGFATNTDGTHITKPNIDTIASCLDQSLHAAGLSAKDIGYINAHGTATVFGDLAEATATAQTMGSRIPMSSLKSYTGHTLGACGALESILSIEMMNHNWFAPTLNLTHPDSRCPELNHIIKEPLHHETEFIMNNNFAFGGINTSLIFKRVNHSSHQ